MAFPSITFLFFFLPLTLLCHYQVPVKWKNSVLLAASLLFYAWGEPLSVFLLLLNLAFNYFAGIKLEQMDTERLRKIAYFTAVGVNVLLWALLQYGPGPIARINALFSLQLAERAALPLGLTVCTVQGIGYLTDIYRREARAQCSFVTYGVYAAMFPKLAAGPITRYPEMRKELARRSLHQGKFSDGALRFTMGLGKKVLLADQLRRLWEQAKADQTPGAATAWLGIIAFALWIYFDFSAYSDMAVGLGKMLGFTLPENFNLPYTAGSLRSFWRRWQMSLTNWFRDVLYQPLAGRKPSPLWVIPLMLVCGLLMGAWHGSGWLLPLWGIYSALLLLGEYYLWGKLLEKAPQLLRQAVTLLLVLLGWVFFSADGIPQAIGYFAALFGANGMGAGRAGYLFSSYGMILLVCVFGAGRWPRMIGHWLEEKHPNLIKLLAPAAMVLVLVLCTAYLVDGGAAPFWFIS